MRRLALTAALLLAAGAGGYELGDWLAHKYGGTKFDILGNRSANDLIDQASDSLNGYRNTDSPQISTSRSSKNREAFALSVAGRTQETSGGLDSILTTAMTLGSSEASCVPGATLELEINRTPQIYRRYE
jgi:hypothetical protein